jgi:hypothetical protein
MKYDDDELAEAALLLAHVEADKAMPSALEKKIRERGEAAVAEVRFTTTKAAAVSVEPPPEPIPLRPSSTRTWAGWLAAAACVALVVYQWRSSAIERSLAARVVEVPGGSPIVLKSKDGATVGEVRWDPESHAGALAIDDLRGSQSGSRFELWLSASDEAHAVGVGSFACLGACEPGVFRFEERQAVGTPKRAWLVRAKEFEVASLADREQILAEGSDATPR